MLGTAVLCSGHLFAETKSAAAAWLWLGASGCAWWTWIGLVVQPPPHRWVNLWVQQTGELARCCEACGKLERRLLPGEILTARDPGKR